MAQETTEASCDTSTMGRERMRIEFTYTLEDITEMLSAESSARNPRRSPLWPMISWLGWLILVTGLGTLYWLMDRAVSSSRPPEPPQDLMVELLPSYLPAFLLFALYAWTLWKLWRKSHWRAPTAAQTSRQKEVVRRILPYAFGFGIWWTAKRILSLDPPIIWYPSRTQMLLAGLAPWAINFAMIMLIGAVQKSWKPRIEWLSKPSLGRPRVIELDEQGVHITEPETHLDLKWSGVTRARETLNLLVLTTAGKNSFGIPKRGFRDEAAIEQARALLQNKIPNTSFLVRPIGFSVVPRPVIPLDSAGGA